MATTGVLTPGVWFSLGTALKVCVIEPKGMDIEVWIAGTTPADSMQGFSTVVGEPRALPNVELLGGKVWVKANRPNCTVTYATA